MGAALSTERDLLKLLEMILSQARRVTNSDAGSIYLVERDEHDAPKALRFKLAQNDSLPACRSASSPCRSITRASPGTRRRRASR